MLVEQFLLPKGELDPDWFAVPAELEDEYSTPKEFITASLEEWQSQGITSATAAGAMLPVAEIAGMHYAYHRAYKLLSLARATGASSLGLGDLSKSFSADQLKVFRDEAASRLASYQELATAPVTGQTANGTFTQMKRRGRGEESEYGRERFSQYDG